MNAQKEYFVYLLSCFLSGEKPQGREVDYDELYRLADIHDVGAIIANELKAVEKSFQPQGRIASEFTQTIGLTLRAHTHRERAYGTIKALLDASAIPHLFVKGIVVKDCYPVPEMRTSGDIDVIVREEDFDSVCRLTEKQQSLTVTERTGETITVNIADVTVEIHNNADVFGDYFNDVFALAILSDGYTYQLENYDHLLYILCHLAKHLTYRGAGIRMLMDIDVMIRSLHPFDTECFMTLCDKAGIRKTAEAMLSLCVYWFKTPVEATIDFDTEQELLEKFESVMLDGGSFGYEQNAIPVSYLEGESMSFFSRLRVLLKMAFPSREYLKLCFPYYRKHAWLYPIARLNRLWDGVFRKRSAAAGAIQQMTSKSDNGNAQMALMKELEIHYKQR